VVGHDMQAAATMGQLRHMLRALAWSLDVVPAENVARLDRAMADLGVAGMASLVYARISPLRAGATTRELRWTSAGHPAPLLLDPDGRARYLDATPSDPLLGIFHAAPRRDHHVAVEQGSTLLLYTDGLVERRGEHLDTGLERLRVAAEQHHALPVEHFVDKLLAELGMIERGDDTAVLAVRFLPGGTPEDGRSS
jgi:serine phosphatase RsbU (regulator of sigma subunit)